MTRLARCVLVGLTLAAAATAGAQELPHLALTPPALVADDGGGEGLHGQGSYLSGRTLGSGDAIQAQFGWPGLSLSYLHPTSGTVDVGGTFTFNYGFEGRTDIDPGIKFAGLVRLNIFDNGKFNVGVRIDPGIAMYFRYNFKFGFTVPVALAFGVSAGDALMISFGVDMPMTLLVTPDVAFLLPILTGVGVEYHVDSRLTVMLDTRFGPSIGFERSITDTEFAFRTLAGIGYRF